MADSPVNSSSDSPANADESGESLDRREFVSVTSVGCMAAGLAASYGTFVVMAGRFLYPSGDSPTGLQFVATVDEMAVGESLNYVAPSGEKIVVARQGEGDTEEDFIALSSVCPHLGCQVHWEPQNDRFFCPCHNGAFDAQGRATEGPPQKANQQLLRFPVKVEEGLVYIDAPLRSVVSSDTRVAAQNSPRRKGVPS